MIPTRAGKKLLMVNGYTYAETYKYAYYCSKRHAGCKARVKLTKSDYLDFKLIPTPTGKHMIMVNEYTFNRFSRYVYYCSKRHSNCKVRLRLTKDMKVSATKSIIGTHTHPPPEYMLTPSGQLVKHSNGAAERIRQSSGVDHRVADGSGLGTHFRAAWNRRSWFGEQSYPEDQSYWVVVLIWGAVFSITKRGAEMISYQGYKFLRQRKQGYKTRWLCGTHNNKGCRANIYTLGRTIIKGINIHNHSPLNIPEEDTDAASDMNRKLWKICDTNL
ncbi:unnamed protein product [Pieris macdunnoughi]|uniref:FLYWCH-type domain-containing protein n=1 Tax=Pieris macdunnoughi TaxID=345717 RepID=A0A821QF87_9NEOP|nr:unnamed protein product [Pieris macdunnoughi]